MASERASRFGVATIAALFSLLLLGAFHGVGPGARHGFDGDGGILPAAKRLTASAVALRNSAGEIVYLSDFKGKVSLVYVWTTWCPQCRDAVPWLNELQETYRDQGLKVLGVTLDEEGWDCVRAYIDDHDVRYPVLMATDKSGALIDEVSMVPTVYFIDRGGRVAFRHAGPMSGANAKKILGSLID